MKNLDAEKSVVLLVSRTQFSNRHVVRYLLTQMDKMSNPSMV